MPVTGRAKAVLDGTTLAETDTYEVVEGNVYFPPAAIKPEFFTKTDLHTHCPWKGDASYYTVKVADKELENAAWYYPETKDKANHIRGYVAFYKNKVDVSSE